jgi:transposase-like protein
MARRTREIWCNLVAQYERSGKTLEEFAKERDLPAGTLRGWIYRFKCEQEEAAPILPVTVVASTAPTARPDGTGVEVMLLRFASSATGEFIADVVSRLRRC